MKQKPLRPKLDASQLAKYIVDLATGEIEEEYPPAKNPAAVALGKLGGSKGGKIRAAKLSPERRSEIARQAANTRWKNKS